MDEKSLSRDASDNIEMAPVVLPNDMGEAISFVGRLAAEHSFFDEDSGMLTRQKLYLTEDGAQAYHVISTIGDKKERRSYIIRREGQVCSIYNGSARLELNTVDVLLVVKGLCGIKNAEQGGSYLDNLEDLVDSAANE